jgi:hypothetical protein
MCAIHAMCAHSYRHEVDKYNCVSAYRLIFCASLLIMSYALRIQSSCASLDARRVMVAGRMIFSSGRIPAQLIVEQVGGLLLGGVRHMGIFQRSVCVVSLSTGGQVLMDCSTTYRGGVSRHLRLITKHCADSFLGGSVHFVICWGSRHDESLLVAMIEISL